MSSQTSPRASNPLDLTPQLDERIRIRAYHLWDAEGRPLGRDEEYWERARELEAIASSPGAGQVPVEQPEIVDEAVLQDNLGEFPDRLSDQGEHRSAPMTRAQERVSSRSP
jgi:hypothetical protein